MKKIKVAIVGFGIVGQRRFDILKNIEEVEIVAVCDRDTSKCSVEKKNISVYSDYKDLLSNKPIDAVFISLTNDVAPKAAIDFLEQGIHAFCEKPPGRTVDDIRNVIRAENNSNVVLMYGFNHRYHDSVVNTLDIIKSGELGRVINIRGIYGKSMLVTFNQSDWRTKKSVAGGGVLLDQGIHMVDLMRLFAGEFTTVHSFISNSFWGYDVEDNAYALMSTDTGIVGILHSSATEWRHRFSLDVTLEKGAIKLEGILSGSKSYGNETMTVVHSKPNIDNGNPSSVTSHYNVDYSWEREIKKFIDLIGNEGANKSINNTSNSNEALKTMELVFKIYESDLGYN